MTWPLTQWLACDSVTWPLIWWPDLFPIDMTSAPVTWPLTQLLAGDPVTYLWPNDLTCDPVTWPLPRWPDLTETYRAAAGRTKRATGPRTRAKGAGRTRQAQVRLRLGSHPHTLQTDADFLGCVHTARNGNSCLFLGGGEGVCFDDMVALAMMMVRFCCSPMMWIPHYRSDVISWPASVVMEVCRWSESLLCGWCGSRLSHASQPAGLLINLLSMPVRFLCYKHF